MHCLLQVQAVTKKMEENRREFETKLDEYARLLDLRAARIKVPFNPRTLFLDSSLLVER